MPTTTHERVPLVHFGLGYHDRPRFDKLLAAVRETLSDADESDLFYALFQIGLRECEDDAPRAAEVVKTKYAGSPFDFQGKLAELVREHAERPFTAIAPGD